MCGQCIVRSVCGQCVLRSVCGQCVVRSVCSQVSVWSVCSQVSVWSVFSQVSVWSVCSQVSVWCKLQALVYDILPSTTAVFRYAVGSSKLSANEQFFVGAQTVVDKTMRVIYSRQQS